MIGLVASLLEAPLVVREPMRRLDAIVVLGAPLRKDRPSPVLAERIAAAAALWHAGGAPIVVATGGVTYGGTRAEADVMAEQLRDRGVTEVRVEAASKTTAENARFTAALLGTGTRVWLVTQPFHGRRAARLFRTAGLEPHVWHIADSIEYRDRKRALKWLAREYAAWGALLLRR
ncbi:MAG: YdcF family protein [Kofleriaceae bacterium]